MKEEKQKVALVTGSSKGIGQAIAIRLAKDGYIVYVTYNRTREGGEDTVATIEKAGGKAILCNVDITRESMVEELFNDISKRFGFLNVLVNNAGLDVSKQIEKSTLAEWKLAFDTKVHGAWLCTKYAIPLLAKSDNPNIIVVSSTADKRPPADVLSYATATSAVNCLVKAWSVHLAEAYRIRVNAVMLGPTRTDNWGDLKNDTEFWKKFAKDNPLGRVGTPEEAADAVSFLINDPHRFIN